ncbi:MAG: adenylate/guanylate cyclase domain-containing protein [Actinomycetota bacterium]
MSARRPRTSIATRLALSVLTVTVTSLIITVVVGLDSTDELTDDLVRARLEAVRSSRTLAVESYVGSVERQAVLLGESPMATDAAAGFTDGALELLDLSDAVVDPLRVELLDLYRDDVIPPLEAARGEPVNEPTVFPTGSIAIYLQANYRAAADGLDVDVDLINDARDGSAWTDVHAQLHGRYLEVAAQLDYEDILIVDADTRVVVYSVAKEAEFGTSLQLGPFSGSGLANLVDDVIDDPQGGAKVRDFAPYAPAGDRPQAFVGAPVLDGGRVVAAMVVRISPDEIDRIMTGEGDWEEAGLGETGEVYLVGGDDQLRSEARVFLEDRPTYLETTAEVGTVSAADQRRIVEGGTTIGVQDVDPASVEAALEADGELITSTNYLGREVLSGARAVDLDGLEWVVISEIERDELDAPAADLQERFLITIASAVVLLTFAAVAWANRAVLPIRLISDRLQRSGDARTGKLIDDQDIVLPPRSPVEFTRLADTFQRMRESLRERQRAVEAASAERLDVLRRLLPPGVARRVERGDRQVLDVVPQVTVVVLIVHGLGQLVRPEAGPDERHTLARLLDELDELAERNGVERIKLTGDAYFGACGIGRPYLDHAPRVATFALAARDAIVDLDTELAESLDLAAGISTGEISVGLTGSSKLVYDAWGTTVGAAHYLARSAGPGELLVSGPARELLPEGIETVERGELDARDIWRLVRDTSTTEVSS